MTKTLDNLVFDRIKFDPTMPPGQFETVINHQKIRELGCLQADFFNSHFESNDQIVLMPIGIAGSVRHPHLLLDLLEPTPIFPNLIDYIEIDCESYHNEKSSSDISISHSAKLAQIVKGRRIALIDTMFDSGRTVCTILHYLEQFEPIDITLILVISKIEPADIIKMCQKYPLFSDVLPLIMVPEGYWYRGWGMDDKRFRRWIEAKIPE